MFEWLYLGIFVGILNGARGSGESFFTSKGMIGLYLGLTMVLLSDNMVLFSVGILFYLAVLLGWGKGFATIHGIYNESEKEIEPIDIITDSFLIDAGFKNGIIWMTLRGILFIPMFWGNLYFSIGCLLMGVIYYAAGRVVQKFELVDRNPVRIAECIFGGLLGIALGGCYL